MTGLLRDLWMHLDRKEGEGTLTDSSTRTMWKMGRSNYSKKNWSAVLRGGGEEGKNRDLPQEKK